MTDMPRNREELVEFMAVRFVPLDVGDSARTSEAEMMLRQLDAAGLAIVPKEPTEEMIGAAFATTSPFDLSGDVQPGPAYRAMLAVSPYRGKE